MALIRLDEKNMLLNVVSGALEEYTPTDKVKALSTTVDGLRAKMIEFQSKEQEFYKNEIIPVLNEIRTQIKQMNEDRYPELKKLREDTEKQAAGKNDKVTEEPAQ